MESGSCRDDWRFVAHLSAWLALGHQDELPQVRPNPTSSDLVLDCQNLERLFALVIIRVKWQSVKLVQSVSQCQQIAAGY